MRQGENSQARFAEKGDGEGVGLRRYIVEWFFGDTRSMVGSATNKLQAKAANAADRKAGAFNRGRHEVVENNNSKTDSVFKRKQNRCNT